jgi:CBS domain-containing protein
MRIRGPVVLKPVSEARELHFSLPDFTQEVTMTSARELVNSLGVDLNGTSKRWSRRVRRRTPGLFDDVPSTWLWIGAGVLGAAVAATVMRKGVSGVGSRRVGDVMVKNVLTIEGSASMQEAAQRMREANVGVLPVVEAGRLRGVITDRDLVVRGMARGMDPAQTHVRYIATEELACARPEWDVDEAMRVMSDSQVGRLPVIDEDGRVIGIVTLSSLALRANEERETLHAAQEVSRRSARLA